MPTKPTKPTTGKQSNFTHGTHEPGQRKKPAKLPPPVTAPPSWDTTHAKIRRFVHFGFPGPAVCARAIDAACRLQIAGLEHPHAVFVDTDGAIVLGWIDHRTRGDVLRVEVCGVRGRDAATVAVVVGPTAHADLERRVCELLGVPLGPEPATATGAVGEAAA